eukprot:4726792-Prymnesium_polylepis.1
MTTVGDDDDGVALGIAGIASNALDAGRSGCVGDINTRRKHGVSGSQCEHDARTAGLRSM